MKPRKLFIRGLIVQLIIIIVLAIGLVKACSYISERGLKNIVDEIWYGEEK